MLQGFYALLLIRQHPEKIPCERGERRNGEVSTPDDLNEIEWNYLQ